MSLDRRYAIAVALGIVADAWRSPKRRPVSESDCHCADVGAKGDRTSA